MTNTREILRVDADRSRARMYEASGEALARREFPSRLSDSRDVCPAKYALPAMARFHVPPKAVALWNTMYHIVHDIARVALYFTLGTMAFTGLMLVLGGIPVGMSVFSLLIGGAAAGFLLYFGWNFLKRYLQWTWLEERLLSM